MSMQPASVSSHCPARNASYFWQMYLASFRFWLGLVSVVMTQFIRWSVSAVTSPSSQMLTWSAVYISIQVLSVLSLMPLQRGWRYEKLCREIYPEGYEQWSIVKKENICSRPEGGVRLPKQMSRRQCEQEWLRAVSLPQANV